MYLSSAAAELRVLCLDKDREWLNIMSRELKAAGIHNVQLSTDPKNALNMMQHNEIDLVLCNHNLKFVKFLRQSKSSPNPEVPVIMVTSQVSPESIFAMRDAGVNEVAAKPCSIKQLVQRIESVASNPRDFVHSESFAGPDRRRRDTPHGGPERRTDDA